MPFPLSVLFLNFFHSVCFWTSIFFVSKRPVSGLQFLGLSRLGQVLKSLKKEFALTHPVHTPFTYTYAQGVLYTPTYQLTPPPSEVHTLLPFLLFSFPNPRSLSSDLCSPTCLPVPNVLGTGYLIRYLWNQPAVALDRDDKVHCNPKINTIHSKLHMPHANDMPVMADNKDPDRPGSCHLSPLKKSRGTKTHRHRNNIPNFHPNKTLQDRQKKRVETACPMY